MKQPPCHRGRKSLRNLAKNFFANLVRKCTIIIVLALGVYFCFRWGVGRASPPLSRKRNPPRTLKRVYALRPLRSHACNIAACACACHNTTLCCPFFVLTLLRGRRLPLNWPIFLIGWGNFSPDLATERPKWLRRMAPARPPHPGRGARAPQ